MYQFDCRVTEMDKSGYYYVRWDRARARDVSVVAENEKEAYKKLWALLGDCPRGRGWCWTAKIDKVTAIELLSLRQIASVI